MPALSIIRASLILALAPGAVAAVAETAPVVYDDEYVSIRAAIADVGVQPIHLGDAISLVMQLEFDASELRVETLDGEFFQRAFADKRSIKAFAPPAVRYTRGEADQLAVDALWQFQILACPMDQENCRGDKVFELPVISVSYQIIDDAGQVVNDKSARFRPWPGRIAVASALADPYGPAGEFADYFPGGAHPSALAVGNRQAAGLVAALAGILLLVAVYNRAPSKNQPQQHATHSHGPENRWQHALNVLQNESLPDDQWADLLRRCASWYCLDELGRNPHTRMNTKFDRFFGELLNEESIDISRRSDYLGRFGKITGQDT